MDRMAVLYSGMATFELTVEWWALIRVMSLKAEKELFVSGHGGTSVLEIAAVLVSLVAGYALRNVLLVCVPELARATRVSALLSFLLDFTTLVLPGILVFTVLADFAVHVGVALTLCSGLTVAYSIWRAPGPLTTGSVGEIPYTFATYPFVTATRTYTNLFTAIAILAVDFSIYPRRFAKTETYGTGLMDIGVGLFMLAHGITAPEARSKSEQSGYVWRLLATGRRVFPLLALGLVRLASVKATDYQEHVTEYGVHWNFFFTIAVVRLLCTALHPLLSLLPLLPYASGCLLLTSLHQILLSLAGGTHYVLLGPSGDGSRLGLLSANREGVVSCVGYLAVYMGSIELGRWLFQHRKCVRDFLPVLGFLSVGVVLLWTLTSVCEAHVQLISRRLTNLPFILWIFSQAFLVLLLFLAIDLLLVTLSHSLPPPCSLPSPLYSLPQPTTSKLTHTIAQPPPNPGPPPRVCVISAIDYNQLGFFLLANVLTGLVNFSVDTLHTRPPLALCVLAVYMCLLVGVFLVLHRHRIKLKI